MTVVSCSIDERHVNPLFEVFDGGDLILSSYRDVEDDRTTLQIFLPDPAEAPRAVEALVAAGRIVGIDLHPAVGSIPDEDWKLAYRKHFKTDIVSPRLAIVPEWELASFVPAHGQKALVLDVAVRRQNQIPSVEHFEEGIDVPFVDRTGYDRHC